jgi:glycosyltransferase involved in cell wall biosynthesis
MEGMKILWMSDSPGSPSGFGNVTRFVCGGLADRGHRLSIIGWQARGAPTSWHNCTVYPTARNSFGAEVLLGYLQRLQPDVLVTLADIWWLTYIRSPHISAFLRTAGIPWVLYYPVDGDTGQQKLPPSWIRILESVDLPIAMANYGMEVARANGLTSAYIPHGVDTSVFRPPSDKHQAKRALGYDGKFVVLSDARNQPRKMLPRTLEVFRRFAAGKDDVLLHLHCDPKDPAARALDYCYDVRADVELLGLAEKVRFTDGMSMLAGISLADLAAIYQASDVHLLSSWGEGFGLPSLQAAAAGVVPMACAYTASKELVEGHGEAVRVSQFLTDQFGIQRALIDIDDAVDRLEALYSDQEKLARKSAACVRFSQDYDWKRIVPRWNELLLRELTRLRNKARYTQSFSTVTINPLRPNVPQRPSTSLGTSLATTVRSAFADIPDGATVTVNVVENKLGELAAGVLRDAATHEEELRIPVTLPSCDTALAERRNTGCVYAASQKDMPVLVCLSRVFPRLGLWSTAALELLPENEGGDPQRLKPMHEGTLGYRKHLAATTLALDLSGANPGLPGEAADLGVPCIGSRNNPMQEMLWPELTLDHPSTSNALALARTLLTDQAEAAKHCERARAVLADMLAGKGVRDGYSDVLDSAKEHRG